MSSVWNTVQTERRYLQRLWKCCHRSHYPTDLQELIRQIPIQLHTAELISAIGDPVEDVSWATTGGCTPTESDPRFCTISERPDVQKRTLNRRD